MSARTQHAREVYDAHVRALPREVQLQLVAVIATEAAHGSGGATPPRFSELAGLGAEVWEGVNPDEYVGQLRDEWNRQP